MSTITQVMDTLQNLTNAKINQSDIARALNITRATVSARVKTESQVTFEEIKKLEEIYKVDLMPASSKETRIEELKQLIEELQANQKKFDKTIEQIKSGKKPQADTDDCISLTVRGNIAASLGQGIEIIDETQTGNYYISKHLMRDLGANPNHSEMVPAEGDSMEPTIAGGSLLLVDHSKKNVIDGKIYCVRLNNMLMAKRLQFLPPNKIAVISDNQKYKTFEVNLSKQLDFDFAIIGEVRWWASVAR